MAVLPGFFEVYNRFPYDFEFTCNSRPYVIPAHDTAVMTLEMTSCCLRQSQYFITMEGNRLLGCVLTHDTLSPSEPLEKEDLPDYQLELPEQITLGGITYGPAEKIKTPQTDLLPTKKRIDAKLNFQAVGGE